MQAWRFYGFNDMRLDEVARPVLSEGHVIADILCVQPSVTEAQLAYGIPTLAYDQIKQRLETSAPIQLFGHEFCARIVEADADSQFRPATVWRPVRSCRVGTVPFATPSAVNFADEDQLSVSNCPVALLSPLCSPKSP